MAGTRAPAVAVDPMTNYARVLAGISVAESRHDFASKARPEPARSRPDPETIGLIYQEQAPRRSQAQATGNGYAIFRITQDMNGLCGPAAVKASLSFCCREISDPAG